MRFIADLHVHSKYSRATARNLELEHLHEAAQLRGITLLGTGDFTHPAWFAELKEKLVPAGEGVFRLRDDLSGAADAGVPESCRNDVRSILQCEISNIYKKDGATRKNHHVIYVPDLDAPSRGSSPGRGAPSRPASGWMIRGRVKVSRAGQSNMFRSMTRTPGFL